MRNKNGDSSWIHLRTEITGQATVPKSRRGVAMEDHSCWEQEPTVEARVPGSTEQV